jgi:hypothetical protein
MNQSIGKVVDKPDYSKYAKMINEKVFGGSSPIKTYADQEAALLTLFAKKEKQQELAPDPSDQTATKAWESKIDRIDNEISVIQTFGGFMDMSLSELENAYDNLRNVIKNGRTKWREFEINRKIELSKKKWELAKDITGEKDPAPETYAQRDKRQDKEKRSTIHQISRKLSQFDTIHQSWRFLMDKLSRKGEGKTLQTETVKIAGRLAHGATSLENRYNQDAMDALTAKLESLTGKKGRALKRWIEKMGNEREKYTVTTLSESYDGGKKTLIPKQ